MNLREPILDALEACRGEFLSGEELAGRLQVSRNAVWKAVKALRAEGAPIDAVTNRGYRLSEDADRLSVPGVRRYLTGEGLALTIEVYDQVESTNTLARLRAAENAPEGLAVLTSAQTAGRGRMGRQFYSPADTGLYMSLLLRPKLPAHRAIRITTAAAVAVCDTLEALGAEAPAIKWVNDVYANGKKVCGILTEAAFDMESGGMEYAVLGVGVNVCPPAGGFPPELVETAGAAFPVRRGDRRNALAGGFLSRFMELYRELESASFAEAYRRRCFVIGRRVRIIHNPTDSVNRREQEALVLDVDDECRLIVRGDDGETRVISSGEISLRTAD